MPSRQSGSSSVHPRPEPAKEGASTGKRLLIAAVGTIAFFLLVSVMNSPKKPEPVYAPQVPKDQQGSPPPVAWQPPTPAPIQVPSRPTEVLPPVGKGLTLDPGQIRYCVAEGIRIDSSKRVVDKTSELQITTFNKIVENYNSRCAQFRYRNGSLEEAKAAVEPYRKEIESEGVMRMVRSAARSIPTN